MNTSPLVPCSDLPEISRPDPQTVPSAGGDKAPTPPKRSLRVLCIDDDEQILEMMKDCLAHFEHQVRVASGGKHGVELFCTAILKSEPYDAVITDLRMPDMDGYEVARMIKAESPGTPVIMMTGEGKSPAGGAGSASAVDVVIGKPPRIQELNELLLRMVV
jgi:DNA-binding response OmpR family regulator